MLARLTRTESVTTKHVVGAVLCGQNHVDTAAGVVKVKGTILQTDKRFPLLQHEIQGL